MEPGVFIWSTRRAAFPAPAASRASHTQARLTASFDAPDIGAGHKHRLR